MVEAWARVARAGTRVQAGLAATAGDAPPPVAGSSAGSAARAYRSGLRVSGLTLLELMFALAVAAILTVLAVGQFSEYVERSKSEAARGDIVLLEAQIQRYRSDHSNALPESLADIGRADFLDPWQRPYHYTKLEGVKGKGSARKDRRLNPLNTDYDLFSAGKNGVYKPQVSQKDSLDDIIRARDGAFIGRAADF
jgi:general secretion pathway protein G